LKSHTPLVAASLLNARISGENIDAISAQSVCLREISHADWDEELARFSQYLPDVAYARGTAAPEFLKLSGFMNPRLGVRMSDYEAACRGFAEEVTARVRHDTKNVLVVGTEEFMYPALFVGGALCRAAQSVTVQATTRSPILPCREEGYPLFSRFSLRSCYEDRRRTFLYNLQAYDLVLVLTDAACDGGGIGDLQSALRHAGNEDVRLIRWVQ
jgi:hypothetical protein